MGLFSFLSKKKQDGKGEAEFYSRADSDAKPRKRKQGKAAARQMDDEEPLDPVLPEKKRARRRLVGAVALVLAMIIGLPMLLDSEPKPVADDIAIQIPSRDKPPAPDASTSVPAPTTAPAAASAATSAPATTSGSVPASASLGPHEQIVNLPPPTEVKPKPADTAAADKPVAKPEKPADKPAEKPAEKPADKLAEKPASDKDKQSAKAETKHDDKDDARAQAILNGKDADSKPAEKKGGKFVVQVAALTSKEKINELQGKLSDAGFKPLLQTVPTDAGPTTRVRVGPFASKEEAESAQAKLTKLGLSGKLLPL